MSQIKQVIVIRKDLNMRKGKMIAQGAHASMGALLSAGDIQWDGDVGVKCLIVPLDNLDLERWLEGAFTKICVSVDSEAELLEVFEKAEQQNLVRCLITDNGATEFNGVKTVTCCAIGPCDADTLFPITGHLKLL
jgi:PTH2 family peptidyl-tRNA hydrolase